MKFLNTEEGLDIEEIDDDLFNTCIQELTIKKEFLDYTVADLHKTISDYLRATYSDQTYHLFKIIFEDIKRKDCINLYYSIVSILTSTFDTGEAKFEERRLGIRENLVGKINATDNITRKLLNSKSELKYFQIEVYRKNKLMMSLV